MDGAQLSIDQTFRDAQQNSIRHLKEHLPHSHTLEQLCPLQRFGHNDTNLPTEDLGDLHKLPVELRCAVLGELDLKSLLAFSKVNRCAVRAVESMQSWKKVMKCAPNAIRMAIGIQTTHLFTVDQLASALDQRKCVDCGLLAPYLDVFTLDRCCLNTGGGCGARTPYRCRVVDKDWENFGIPQNHVGRLQLSSFRPLPGYYLHGIDDDFSELCIKPEERHLVFDGDAVVKLLRTVGHSTFLSGDVVLIDDWEDGYNLGFWHLSAVFAQWPSILDGEYALSMGVFCGICRNTSKYQGLRMDNAFYEPWNPISLSEGEEKELAMRAPLFSESSELIDHMKEVHGIVGLHDCADRL
ncbi:hypothetical protein P171DRAFT_441043 [Karstenula rhodostoma CBS 690.94]|uniref:F-box domain-containing protein n=1 Tax=Karstenula rhodostoma CBS 690.94 TaxID=1392251 RepID=A0A9P4PQT5_9PLEO|nr:hypothetical protein P171DRAFT_441043 [Karstenula rhodostoma CBS 690.94]